MGKVKGPSQSSKANAAQDGPPMFSKRAKKQAAKQHQDVGPDLSPNLRTEPETVADLEISGDVTFRDLGLGEWLEQTCREMGIVKPSPVQRACVPPVLQGEDVIGCAQTGSGKTAAFALPILQKLAEDPFGIFALVLTPTRELAFQIADQFRALVSCDDQVVFFREHSQARLVLMSLYPQGSTWKW
jgi:ATP-dependent RNA helicase DDX49/DBP8